MVGLGKKNETAATKFLSSNTETEGNRVSQDIENVEEEIRPIGSVEVKTT